ncbi:MAG: UDP-N-acetyl-D-glucosamine dehydrogenase, partial [Acidobacteria bacterium]|nr:UDP-N-acetyl-D-glucosamine dehydrogenase [Acidobacteriota bacterium]
MQPIETTLTDCSLELEDKIRRRTASVGVLGLGYVGLPLAVEFAKAGFPVTGIDVHADRVAAVNAGGSYVLDVPGPSPR